MISLPTYIKSELSSIGLEDIFRITNASSEGFHVNVFPTSKNLEFTFEKYENDLVIFKKGNKKEFNEKTEVFVHEDNITHIDFNGVKIYFDQYVIADKEHRSIIVAVIGYLTTFYKK
ncbi:uncharacterized protein OCT59_002860 [Rhizophagus irregularis]|uniref:uncharacterized protein n=1 Tax=Rhizophagus irregularis TaxID=588596 RepID=UPI000CB2AB75|nr:hypothetical protein OCT59_002860 [Rhizophagus irregularis]GBC36562.1 hypothetical protein GLOIN_2v1883137 [Rhizophagus irregularis DAOM 181602=DAOM 197198]CAG8480870.1 12503_t:CDS:1 [Rhizophagus irregularis]